MTSLGNKTIFARNLTYYVERSGRSQKELAERIGIAKSVISFYESGDRFPSYDVLIKIARIFNVTTDYLLDVERERTVNVSGLSEEDIAAVTTVMVVSRVMRKIDIGI